MNASALRVRSLRSELAPVVFEHRWLLLLVSAYGGAALFLRFQLQLPSNPMWSLLGGTVSLVTGLTFTFCGYAIYVMAMIRPQRLTQYLIGNLRQLLTRARVLYALPVLLLIPEFANIFTFFKASIPNLRPYVWDAQLAEWDRLLHGGVQPWAWLQPVFGHPLVTSAINFCYHLWFFIMYVVIHWQAFCMENRSLRMQFLLSFVLTWMLFGTVAAILLSSAGPCYYGHFVAGANPYAPLMHYLNDAARDVPVWALDVQQMLWEGYQNRGAIADLGISAMPSMHVATSVLLALLGWRVHRAAGIALTTFAAIIMIGSVHLGWHYAIDGYVGALGAFIVWRCVGWSLSERQPTKPTSPTTSAFSAS